MSEENKSLGDAVADRKPPKKAWLKPDLLYLVKQEQGRVDPDIIPGHRKRKKRFWEHERGNFYRKVNERRKEKGTIAQRVRRIWRKRGHIFEALHF